MNHHWEKILIASVWVLTILISFSVGRDFGNRDLQMASSISLDERNPSISPPQIMHENLGVPMRPERVDAVLNRAKKFVSDTLTPQRVARFRFGERNALLGKYFEHHPADFILTDDNYFLIDWTLCRRVEGFGISL